MPKDVPRESTRTETAGYIPWRGQGMDKLTLGLLTCRCALVSIPAAAHIAEVVTGEAPHVVLPMIYEKERMHHIGP